LSRYIAKCKYTLKMIQIIAKLDEGLRLHCTISITIKIVWLMWFQEVQMNRSVLKKKKNCSKTTFIEKWQELCCRPLYQKPFYIFIKTLDEIKEELPPKYTKIYAKKSTFFYLKQPPLVCFHPLFQNFIT